MSNDLLCVILKVVLFFVLFVVILRLPLYLYLRVKFGRFCVKEINELEEYYNSFDQMKDVRFRFTAIYFPGILEATSEIKNMIEASSGWAAQLIDHPSEKTKNAFILTLGHELGHKTEGDFLF